MNYYPFHLGDYAAHTAHLEPMEDLAYRRMLDLYYRTEKPLPTDWAEVARLIRMKDYPAEVQAVLNEFFLLTEEGWRHARCDEELAKMQDKQAKARASAQASVNARIAKQTSERSADVERTLNERSADVELPTPIPIPKEERKTARKRAAPSVLVSVDNLVAEGVDWQHAEDWLTARKSKGLPLTPTAWQQTKDEAEKAKLSIADAIKTAAANGWAGFKASWLVSVDQPRGLVQPITVPGSDGRAEAFLADQNRRAAEATRPPAAILALAGAIGRQA